MSNSFAIALLRRRSLYIYTCCDDVVSGRFRSIAKSYFRRADGVLLLYDVACERSFLNVREWVDMIEVKLTLTLNYIICLYSVAAF